MSLLAIAIVRLPVSLNDLFCLENLWAFNLFDLLCRHGGQDLTRSDEAISRMLKMLLHLSD